MTIGLWRIVGEAHGDFPAVAGNSCPTHDILSWSFRPLVDQDTATAFLRTYPPRTPDLRPPALAVGPEQSGTEGASETSPENFPFLQKALAVYDAQPWVKAIKENGPKWAETRPVGTGAFKFVSYDRPNKLTWTRFDGYWQKGRPYLDGVEYLFIKDRMTALSSLKAGEAHGIFFALPQHAKTMGKEGWDIGFDNMVGISIYVNTASPGTPWANKKVRKAAEYAIDKEAICSQLGLGFKLPVYQIVKSDNQAYVKSLAPRKYDPQKAKQLLKEAGYPNGFNTDFYFHVVGWKDGWQAVQSYLSAVGINMKLIPVDRPKFMNLRFKKGSLPPGSAAQMVSFMPPDALYMARNLLSSKTPHNPEMKRPEGFDKLTDMAIAEKDPVKRLALTRQLVQLAYDEAMYIPFFAEGPLAIMDPKVKGYDFFEVGRNSLCPYINAYIEK